MSRASSVKALSRGVCKLGPSGGTALGVKVRSSATPTCPWFFDHGPKHQTTTITRRDATRWGSQFQVLGNSSIWDPMGT